MLTIKEVAQFLSLSEKTLYRLVQDGALPALKIGGQWRFDPKSLDAWVTNALNETTLRENEKGPKQFRSKGKLKEGWR